MLYFIDLCFVLGYLLMKDVILWLIDADFEIYQVWRKYYMWFELSWVIGGVYFIPAHTLLEGCVAFFASLATKAVHDIIRRQTNTLTEYEKKFKK